MILHIIGTDEWLEVRRAIAEQREEEMKGLLRVQSLEGLHYVRGYISALDWVIAEIDKPPPSQEAA
jgi:hypothetical protein